MKKKVLLFFYNHNRPVIDINKVASIELQNFQEFLSNNSDMIERYYAKSIREEINVEFIKEGFKIATHVVAHIQDQSEEEKPTHENLKDNFPPDDIQYVLVVTTRDGFPSEDYIHLKKEFGSKEVRYILYARKCKEIEKEGVLDAFLHLTPEQAQAIVDGNISQIPCELHDLFGFGKYINTVFFTVSILCQGYLAVWAEAYKKKIWHMSQCGEKKEKTSDVIEHALREMGWFRLSADVKLFIANNIGDRFNEVKDPKWWQEVFEDDDLNELKEYGKSCSGLPELLGCFEKGDEFKPEIVSKAYLGLKAYLEEQMK